MTEAFKQWFKSEVDKIKQEKEQALRACAMYKGIDPDLAVTR